MLKRLFLFDFTAIYRAVIRTIFGILIAALVSCGILLLSDLIPAAASFSVAMNNALTVVFYALIITFAVLVCFCVAQLFMRFYQGFFGEEAAFTRMIPVDSDTLFHAKLLSGALWAGIFLCLGIIAIIFGALLPIEILMRADNLSFLTNFTRKLGDSFGAFSVPALLFSILSKLLLGYFAITLGAILFPRRGVLGAILFVLLLLSADILLHGILSMLTTPIFEWDGGFTENLPDIFSLLLSLLLGGGAFLGTKKLLSRHISLYY